MSHRGNLSCTICSLRVL